MDIEKQIFNIEKGKQIGYYKISENSELDCGIQKNNNKYLVYIAFHDYEYDFMDSGREEFYSFSDLKKAIEYIVSRDIPIEEFFPQKGNKIFYTEWFNRKNITVVDM